MAVDLDDIRARISEALEADDQLSMRNVSVKAIGSDSALHKFVTGATRSMKVDNLANVADALRVSLAWLLFGREMAGGDGLSANEIEQLVSESLDELQVGMSIGETRRIVAARLSALLARVLSAQAAIDPLDALPGAPIDEQPRPSTN